MSGIQENQFPQASTDQVKGRLQNDLQLIEGGAEVINGNMTPTLGQMEQMRLDMTAELARRVVASQATEGHDTAESTGSLPREQQLVDTSYGTQLEFLEAHGIDESKLRGLIMALHTQDKPYQQMPILNVTVTKYELGISEEDLYDIAKAYQIDRIRKSEKGPLNHYHQTSLSRLDGIIQQGGLLSHNLQKELGIAGNAAGSRPDVVQFTRDHYDEQGELTKSGLTRSGSIGVAGEVALVFDEAIMDTPGYDSITEYPNVSVAPLSLLKSIILANEQNVKQVQESLAKLGIRAEVTSRESWAEQHQA